MANTLYQEITDICFENGGVTRPMVDKLEALIAKHQKDLLLRVRDEVLSRDGTDGMFTEWNGMNIADLDAQRQSLNKIIESLE